MHSNRAWNTRITCHQLPTKSLETVFRKSSIATLTGNKTCLLVVAVVMIWKCRSSKCWWWSRGVCTFQVSKEVGCSRLQGQDERRVCKCWGRRITTARDEDGEIGDRKNVLVADYSLPFVLPHLHLHTHETHTHTHKLQDQPSLWHCQDLHRLVSFYLLFASKEARRTGNRVSNTGVEDDRITSSNSFGLKLFWLYSRPGENTGKYWYTLTVYGKVHVGSILINIDTPLQFLLENIDTPLQFLLINIDIPLLCSSLLPPRFCFKEKHDDQSS